MKSSRIVEQLKKFAHFFAYMKNLPLRNEVKQKSYFSSRYWRIFVAFFVAYITCSFSCLGDQGSWKFYAPSNCDAHFEVSWQNGTCDGTTYPDFFQHIDVAAGGYDEANWYVSCDDGAWPVSGCSFWLYPDFTKIFTFEVSKYGTNLSMYAHCNGQVSSSPPGVDDGNDGPNHKGPGHNEGDGGDNPCGMPVWGVSEPFISLWLNDEPLGYQPAIGPRVSFLLSFKQQESDVGFDTNTFSIGRKWNFSWVSFITQDGDTNNVVHFANGGSSTYSNAVDYITDTSLTGDTTNGFTLTYPDGSTDFYGLSVTNASGGFLKAFLTDRWNSLHQHTHLNYSAYSPAAPVIRLQSVVDGDGRTNTISYNSTNPYSTNLISQVTDPFGRSASLLYDSQGHLTNITDVQGLSSSLAYDANEWVTNLTTPYGTTSFAIRDSINPELIPNGRIIQITEPNGAHQLYMFTNNAIGITNAYPSGEVPSTSPLANTLDNSSMNINNSFHWNRLQYAALSTTNVSSFTAADFLKGRMRHWLRLTSYAVSSTLSMEREASPDGLIQGQKTWYDYAGKTNSEYLSTQIMPFFTAQVLPDGTTAFNRTDRNSIGNVLTNISTYSVGSSVALRTNSFSYSASGIDLLTATNALGVQVTSNAFNSYHQILTNFDALNQKTVFSYNANQQIANVVYPNSLTSLYIYGADNWLATNYSYGVLGGITNYFATNSYTYSNDLILTHTDGRGLFTSNTWDNLQRLIKISYPDGTFITNSYTNLDLTRVVDRLGFTNSFAFNSLRQLVAATNAMGQATYYGYCDCGALAAITNALGQVTQYAHDNQGNLTLVNYPDGYSLGSSYNGRHQITNTLDSAGVSVTNWYNNQGGLIAVSNALGRLQVQTFDVLDRVTTSVDANGVAINKVYDNLNRLTTNSYPDTGVETFGYAYVGLVAYTNPLTQVTYYGYDAAGRKTAVTNANHETNGFTYSAAGDCWS